MKIAYNKSFFNIHLAVFLYSLVSVFSKLASISLEIEGLLSLKLMLTLGIMIFFLAIYAVVWQNILKITDLSVAYLNKAFGLFWTMIWAVLIFNENIHWSNIIGLILIVVGVIEVTKHE